MCGFVLGIAADAGIAAREIPSFLMATPRQIVHYLGGREI